MLSTEKKLQEGRAKYGSIAKYQRAQRRLVKQLSGLIAGVVLFIGIAGVTSRSVRNAPIAVNDTKPVTATVATTVAVTAPANKTLSVFIPAMAANGWSQDTLGVNLVDLGSNSATPGSKPFSKKGINSIEQAISFIKEDSWEAEAARLILLKGTGCSREDLLDSEKWVVAQPKVAFSYSQMTLWDGKIRVVESKAGNAGDIFVAFVHGEKVVFIRGGCANPTLIVPVPNVPAPVKETTTAKHEDTTTTTKKPTTTTDKETTKKDKTTTTTKKDKVTTTKVAKDPSKDVLVNTLVADYKKPGDERMSISWDPYVSNGIQLTPKIDAKKAAEDAAAIIAAANKALEDAKKEAITSGAGVVDSNEEHIAVTKPTTPSGETVTNWSPFS